jgi:hypothetical protein
MLMEAQGKVKERIAWVRLGVGLLLVTGRKINK